MMCSILNVISTRAPSHRAFTSHLTVSPSQSLGPYPRSRRWLLSLRSVTPDDDASSHGTSSIPAVHPIGFLCNPITCFWRSQRCTELATWPNQIPGSVAKGYLQIVAPKETLGGT